MIIDHIGLNVTNPLKSKEFYSKALAPLGISLIMEFGNHLGYGAKGKPDFWITSKEEISTPIHVAFVAENREAVDAFYEAALSAGGKDNGTPGIRELYHPNYYGAFVLDPDGNNIEAVCHEA